jgi:hypothetical protein
MRNLDVAAVAVGDAAYAADLSPAKLSSWLDTRVVRLSARDKTADGSGDRRLLTLKTCHGATLVAELTRLGIRHAVAGAVVRKAMGEPALYAEQAFIVQRGRESVDVVDAMATDARCSVVIDATAVLRDFDARLAARVPELRAAGIV